MYALFDCTNYRAIALHAEYRALCALAYIQFANIDTSVIPLGDNRVYSQFNTEQLESIHSKIPANKLPIDRTDYSKLVKSVRAAVESADKLKLPFKTAQLEQQATCIKETDNRPFSFAPGASTPRKDKAWSCAPQRNRARNARGVSDQFTPKPTAAAKHVEKTHEKKPVTLAELAAGLTPDREACCDAPAITNLMKAPDINKVCENCGAHWFGHAEKQITFYTRAEWDKWVNSGAGVVTMQGGRPTGNYAPPLVLDPAPAAPKRRGRPPTAQQVAIAIVQGVEIAAVALGVPLPSVGVPLHFPQGIGPHVPGTPIAPPQDSAPAPKRRGRPPASPTPQAPAPVVATEAPALPAKGTPAGVYWAVADKTLAKLKKAGYGMSLGQVEKLIALECAKKVDARTIKAQFREWFDKRGKVDVYFVGRVV